jgi:hypothetical protein
LDNFVTAANELRGQMFDSLSAVAEITGVDYDRWLTDIYGNDEAKKQAAIDAARAVQSQEITRAARNVRENERRLASQVDAVAALTLLQRDLFARINPAIVEAYLDRLCAAGLITAQPTVAGPGFRRLVLCSGALPATLGGGSEAPIATSGEAVRVAAQTIDVDDMITLGPGEPAFTDLIAEADAQLAQDMYQSGAAADPTSLTPYDLYAFQARMTESDGHRTSVWATLIKVDDGGAARAVRWETLANLVPTQERGTRPHPARSDAAVHAAQAVAAATVAEHRRIRTDWFAQARRDLMNLPVSLTDSITDRDARIVTHSAEGTDGTVIGELEKLVDVELTEPALVGDCV